METQSPAETFICAVCSVPSTKYCANCRKVYYCSTQHQKADRKLHKHACYPIDLRTDDVQGRHFVAMKSLAAGELIFVDEAIVHGPSGAEHQLHRICIGCCNIMASPSQNRSQGSSVCPRCKWPICGPACASNPCHVEAECPIFTKHGIMYEDIIKSPIDYDLVKYLRTALLKASAPTSWKQLGNLSSHRDARATNPDDFRVTREAFDFICKTCNLADIDVDFEDVNHIVGIWTVNSFGANPPTLCSDSDKRIAASFLFPKTSLASHGCIANTNGILIYQDAKFAMKLYTSTPIVVGEPIYITYVNVAEGTAERQLMLQHSYYFTCQCARCKDPTECRTNYSSVRCTKNACTGFLMPLDPTHLNSPWMCGGRNCVQQADYGNDILELIRHIRSDLGSILYARSATPKLETIQRLEKLLEITAGMVLHPNHWLVVEMEYNLMQLLTQYILSLPGIRTSAEDMKWTSRLVEICNHCLSVANVLQPGLNSYRGNILYCLVEAQLNQIVLQFSSRNGEAERIGMGRAVRPKHKIGGNRNRGELDIFMRGQALKDVILPNAEEAYAILSMEPEASASGMLATKVGSRVNQIRAMIANVNKTYK